MGSGVRQAVRRRRRSAALVGGVALLTVLIGGCEAPMASATLENRTGADVILYDEVGSAVGDVPAGEAGQVWIDPGQGGCVEGLRALTEDGLWVAEVPGYVCDRYEVVLDEHGFVAAASFEVRNETGVDLTGGVFNLVQLGPIHAGGEKVVPMVAAAGECTPVSRLLFFSTDDDGAPIVASFPADLAEVCDGDVLELDPSMVRSSRS